MNLIEVKNLRKDYGETEGVPALNGVSFNISAGELVAIMGPSGSGKSTLLHILGFLDKASSGQYFFDGKSIEDYSEDELAKIRNSKIGFVFQAFNLLARNSVYENVKLPLLYSSVPEGEWDGRIRSSIEAVGLGHRIGHDPAQLSGGEKQRAAIARALVTEPDVIFADEPTGNLDSKNGEAVMKILTNLNMSLKHTIILVTHEESIAKFAGRLIYVKDGKIESDKKI
ncbi:ABC transporter ATP-binding protein [Candidatus Giovannonibacteria bacterium]|nr:ABC transporter ATP-binding protein [Candidatus Giovannonibacteria bacterium]